MKRLLTMCLAVMMVMFMMPSTVKAAGGSVTMTVTADKTTANSGDTVNFQVILGAVTNLGGLDFKLKIPAGLSINPDSVTMQAELKDIMKSDGDIISPSAANDWMWCYSVGSEGYTSSTELCILSFSCTVDADAAFESKTVTLEKGQCFENSAEIDFDDIEVNLVPAVLSVTKVQVAVSGVVLNQTELVLNNGETAGLTAAVEPANADNQSVSWSSSDASVASVGADGTVTALKAGTTVITVTTADGGKTASCTVTVNCNHILSNIDAVESTCDAVGNVEHYRCSECGKTFADAEGTTELADVTTPAKGHTPGAWSNDETNHWRECTVCGNGIDRATHNFSWIVDAAATEDTAGIRHEECTCGMKRNENTAIPMMDHIHTGIQHHAAVEATCTEKGTVEYWTCSSEKCAGRYYGDSACQSKLTDIETPVNPSNHLYDNDTDASCNRCGYTRTIASQDNTSNTCTDNAESAVNTNGADSIGNTDNSAAVSQSTVQKAPKTGETIQLTYLVAAMAVCMFMAAGLNVYGKRKSCK